MSVEIYKRNFLTIINELIMKCENNGLEEQRKAFLTVRDMILTDAIDDKNKKEKEKDEYIIKDVVLDIVKLKSAYLEGVKELCKKYDIDFGSIQASLIFGI